VIAFRSKYGSFSCRELETRQVELRLVLHELSAPVFDEYRMRGEYEVIGVGNRCELGAWDNSQLAQVRMAGEGSEDPRVLKMVIRESDYPELVGMHREDLWINSRIRELQEMKPASLLPAK
jgi:hypothetical protein